jgi:cytoskeleton protein RodZ
MPEIGATLREARMRARIDVSEIEAQTKIRAKYLRALENEEWNLLPGPTFVKSFLRTYAQALGLDGKLLVEEYRLSHERPSEGELQPIVSGSHSSRQRHGTPRSGPSRGYLLAVGAVGVVIVLLIWGLLSGGGSGHKNNAPVRSTATQIKPAHPHGAKAPSRALTTQGASVVALSLQPSAAVYVCLIGDQGRKVIAGQILQPGSRNVTYHAKRFTITLGNSSVKMFIDGTARTVLPSSQPIGYSITKAGRHTLAAGQLPTCK